MKTVPPARRATSHAAVDTGIAYYARGLGGRICDLPRYFLTQIAEANLNANVRVLDRDLRRIVWHQRLARRRFV